ncbi:hypothetical protein Bca52824_024455 [Brassica carinata]|uniref:Uncharacterized protein n=1 Tax=Brassica carinata TaxID=52824 RepID=A0A8X7VKN9_BRACI|nr:hypothetical protein Bca52824_024455 [Brassica carinata]
MKQYKKSHLTKNGKKIAPSLSNKPLFNFIEETFVSACGVKTKAWTLPADEMDAALNGPVMDSANEDSDESDEFIHREFAHHIKNRMKVSVGSTRRCKLSYLRRRRQRLEHKLIKNRAPSVPRFNFIEETFVSACGVKTKAWMLPADEMDAALNEDSDESDEFLHTEFGCGYNPHEPVLSNSSAHHIKKVSVGSTLSYLRRRRRQRLAHKLIKNRAPSVSSFNFTEETFVSACGVKTKVLTLPAAEMDSALNGPVMDSALNEDDEDESDGILIERLGIGSKALKLCSR